MVDSFIEEQHVFVIIYSQTAYQIELCKMKKICPFYKQPLQIVSGVLFPGYERDCKLRGKFKKGRINYL